MKKNNVLLLSVLSFVLIVTGYWWFNKKTNETEVVKIGVILPLSGNLSKVGEPKQKAFLLAQELYNKKSINQKIEFIIEDSKGNPKDGVSAYLKLKSVNKDLKYFYIDLTTVVNACKPIIEKDNVIAFVGSAEAGITENTNSIFRIFPGGDQEIEMITKQLLEENNKKVFVLHTNELYGTTAFSKFKNLFTIKGGTIVGVEKYPLDITDIKPIIAKIKKNKSDKILFLGYGIEYPLFLKQFEENKIDESNIIMNIGATNRGVMTLDTVFTNNIKFVGPKFSYNQNSNFLNETQKEFVNNYKSKYNEIPDFRAAYAYDVFLILQNSWSKSDLKNLQDVKNIIRATKNFDGISGKINFLPNGDSNSEMMVAEYSNGKLQIIK